MITGDSEGNILFWSCRDARIRRVIKNACEGHVFSVLCLGETLVSGGKDGRLVEWESRNLLRTGRVLQMPVAQGGCRVITQLGGSEATFLAGTVRNSIVRACFDTSEISTIVNGHSEELWGLTPMMSSATLGHFLTCGNDKTLSLWDAESHSNLWTSQLEEKLHSLCSHPKHDLCAIGSTKSRWFVFCLNQRMVVYSGQTEGVEQVECIQYSPNGLLLACASRDNFIYVYEVSEDGLTYTKLGRCSGHSSFLTHIDWSAESKYLMSNSGDYEILYWEANACKQLTNIQTIREIEWVGQTSCTLSFNTLGLWHSK